MELFGVGPLEALLVGVIAFILVGPDRFPELARQAGKWYRVARAFTADVMADVQGAVNEIEAEVNASTGGELRSIRELAESSSILREARADAEAATSSAQAAIEPAPDIPPPVTAQAIPPVEATEAVEAAPVQEAPPSPLSAMPAPRPSNGAYGDPSDAAEEARREAAAREAAARVTGGGA